MWLIWGRGGKVGGSSSNIIGSCMDRCEVRGACVVNVGWW